MSIRASRVFSLLVVCLLAAGCHAPSKHAITTLTVGSPVDATSGLRLIAVEADGTAYIEWFAVGQVSILRPNTATNMVSLWTLDSTDSAAQRARLSATHYRRAGFRCWPYEPIEFVKGEERKFTPRELTQIARDHAEKEHVMTVDYSSPYPLIYVFDGGNTVLAQVRFGGKLGEPCLTVEIDKRGRVIRHSLGVVVCGGATGVMDATRK